MSSYSASHIFFITQAVAFNMTLNGTLLEEIEKVFNFTAVSEEPNFRRKKKNNRFS